MARPRITYDNYLVMCFLLQFENYSNVPSWVDDCISGAIGTTFPSTSTGRISPHRLFNIIRCTPEISTECIGYIMNAYKSALDGDTYTDRYIQMMCKAMRCASEAITHNIEKYATEDQIMSMSNLDTDYEDFDKSHQVKFIHAEVMKKLAASKKWDELQDYIINVVNKGDTE